LDLMVEVVDGWAAVVQDFEVRASGNAIDDIPLRIVALRVLGFHECCEIGHSGRRGCAIIPVAWYRHAHFAAWLPVRVVVVGKGKLRHWLIAAFPLRGALGDKMGEENPPALALATCGRGFFAQAKCL